MNDRKEMIYRWSVALVRATFLIVAILFLVFYIHSSIDIGNVEVNFRIEFLSYYFSLFLPFYIFFLYIFFPIVALILAENEKRIFYALRILPLWVLAAIPAISGLGVNNHILYKLFVIQDFFPYILIGSLILLTIFLWRAVKKDNPNILLRKWFLAMILFMIFLSIFSIPLFIPAE